MAIVYQSGMETNSSELEAIFDSIWKNLKLGAIDRKHPFHLCTLSTINSKNTSFPDSRIVVLREADQNLLTLRSHADVRTNTPSSFSMTNPLKFKYESRQSLRL